MLGEERNPASKISLARRNNCGVYMGGSPSEILSAKQQESAENSQVPLASGKVSRRGACRIHESRCPYVLAAASSWGCLVHAQNESNLKFGVAKI